MSYRNQALGSNGSIEISRKSIEITENKKSQIQMYIGLETKENKTKSITFYGKKQSDVNKAVEQIVNAFSEYDCFSGVSIHTVQGYRKLKEK